MARIRNWVAAVKGPLDQAPDENVICAGGSS
jgi:hypothetical protein